MPAMIDAIAQLGRALDHTGSLISLVAADQGVLPTPCASFDVKSLINHVVLDIQGFETMVRGGDWQQSDDDVIGDDWAGSYTAAAGSLMVAWQAQDRPEDAARSRLDNQITDLVVHGWDIAKATGQPTGADPDLAELSLEWARANLKAEYRGPDGKSAFGPEVAVPESAPISDRLAAWMGRDPSWRAGSG